MKVPLSPI